jgi:hypothetical protein
MSAIHSQVVESAGYFHRQIRKAFFGISENIFDNPATFDACNRVFYQARRKSVHSATYPPHLVLWVLSLI